MPSSESSRHDDANYTPSFNKITSDYRYTLQSIHQLLEPGRQRLNLSENDFANMEKSLREIYKGIDTLSGTREIYDYMRSPQAVSNSLKKALNSLTVANSLLEESERGDKSMVELAEGRSALLDYLDGCQQYLETALREFLS